jgi:hypothetical protein
MTLRSYLVFALIVGVAGAFIGRAVSRDAPSAQAAPSGSSAHLAVAPAGHGCKAERVDLASLKAQLALCMAFRTPESEAVPSSIPERAMPDRPEPKLSDVRLPGGEDRETWRQFIDGESGTVLVRHLDGTLGVYHPDEWPIDGDGDIIARKLPSERIGWYAGPDAGPRTDPDAFRPWDPPIPPRRVWNREPDGTITIDGNPASPGVQFMFGGKLDRPSKPPQ